MNPTTAPLDPESQDRLCSPAVAHRGLWSASGAPENSLAAFEAACEAGYGVELDVQLSADGEAMVFHDEHLARMAGAAARLMEKTAAELRRLRLKSSRETIPTLGDVLAQAAGRTMVFIEIKSRRGEEGPLDQRVADVIQSYRGPLAVIGFNPGSHAWWRANRPHVLRGFNTVISEAAAAAGGPTYEKAIGEALRDLDRAAPHFLAPSMSMIPSEGVRGLRRQGLPIVVWTVRSDQQWAQLQPECDNLIFEGFTP